MIVLPFRADAPPLAAVQPAIRALLKSRHIAQISCHLMRHMSHITRLLTLFASTHRIHHEHQEFFRLAGSSSSIISNASSIVRTSCAAASREDMLVIMPGKQLPSKPPLPHGFNRPLDKVSAASASEALLVLLQNYDFSNAVKSHKHTCTAQLMADVIKHVSSEPEQMLLPSSPMRRNSQTSRALASRSPLRSPTRSSSRTSATTLPPPPASLPPSFITGDPSPLSQPTSALSPPASRHGLPSTSIPLSSHPTASRSSSPHRRVSIAASTSPRARRRASVTDAAPANQMPGR